MTVVGTRRIGVGEVRVSDTAIANVLDALHHSRLSYGRYSKEFERRFAALHDRKFAVLVNSGTDALRIGLAAMKEKYGWEDGATVLVPAVTFVASFNVVEQVGLRPMLVDIDRYYGMDPVQVGAILARNDASDDNEQPVAIMPVHLFGQPAGASIHLLAQKFGVRVIADSCETMFVEGCALGDVSCFSTYSAHILQTGVGGLATTNDPKLAMLMRSYANHGRSGIYTGIDDELGQIEVIEARFDFERMGYSSRATEMEAAIGCAELDVYEQNIARRGENAEHLALLLSDLPLSIPEVRPGSQSSWMMFPLRTRTAQERDRLVTHLERHGIETRYSLPLTSQPYIKKRLGDIENRFPVAKIVNERGFYIGCHQYLTDEDIDYVSEVFHDFAYA